MRENIIQPEIALRQLVLPAAALWCWRHTFFSSSLVKKSKIVSDHSSVLTEKNKDVNNNDTRPVSETNDTEDTGNVETVQASASLPASWETCGPSAEGEVHRIGKAEESYQPNMAFPGRRYGGDLAIGRKWLSAAVARDQAMARTVLLFRSIKLLGR